MRFVDRIVDNLDAVLMLCAQSIWRTNPKEFIDLASTDDATTFVLKDGTLMTVLRIKGVTNTLHGQGLKDLILELAEIIGRDLLQNGNHSLSVSFEFDPDQAYQYAKDALRMTQLTARKFGMSSFIDEIVEEKSRKMAEFCQVENTYIALYTYVTAIAKNEINDQVKERAEALKTWPETAEAMLKDTAFPQLRIRHQNMVSSFISTMEHLNSNKDVRLMTEVIDVRSWLKIAKQVIEPGTSEKWTPRISDDFLKEIRVPTKPKRRDFRNADHMMPPPIADQLFSQNIETPSMKFAVMGNRIHYGLAVSMGPMEPETFDRMIIQASSMRLPFRLSISLKANGAGVDYLNTSLAKTFPWASSLNSQIKEAHEGLSQYISMSNGVVPAPGRTPSQSIRRRTE
ncbi:type IV secretion protein IcmB, partial [Marinobacter lutaoensis]